MFAHLALLDFAVSDNDGFYTLLMLVAVALAVVLVVVVMRQSRASDRHLHATKATPPLAADPTTDHQE